MVSDSLSLSLSVAGSLAALVFLAGSLALSSAALVSLAAAQTGSPT
jgi:hypothetical protein